MEYCWTLFNNRASHNNNNAWDSIDASSRPPDHWPTFPLHNSFNFPPPPAADHPHFFNPDPHLTSLKLGKRHYFEDATGTTPPPPEAPVPKKGKSYADGVPRCQVEGCAAVLVKAKDYHRRHKVCEMHAKAPRVVVVGLEQRFCQQCSRFHAVAEFDEAKRSCRRRLAGHNERRRKTSQEQNALARRHSQEMKMMGLGRERGTELVNNNSSECALSLLSSSNPWNHSPDLPARCSAALRELIAENRASILACRHLNQIASIRAGPTPQGNVTLNLMQAPNSAFGLLSMHDHKSPKDSDCSDLWKLPLGY